MLTALLAAPAALAQQVRYFAYEYTRQTGNLIDFYNLTNTQHDVTVDIYNADGTLNGTRTLTLRGYESVTIVDPAATSGSSCDNGSSGANCPAWNLPTTCEGAASPDTECAYGIVATAPEAFSVITMADEHTGIGSGLTAIHPQGSLWTPI